MSIDRRSIRNTNIRSEFREMKARHLETTYVIDRLATKYYLAPRTVWAILSSTGYYATPKPVGV